MVRRGGRGAACLPDSRRCAWTSELAGDVDWTALVRLLAPADANRPRKGPGLDELAIARTTHPARPARGLTFTPRTLWNHCWCGMNHCACHAARAGPTGPENNRTRGSSVALWLCCLSARHSHTGQMLSATLLGVLAASASTSQQFIFVPSGEECSSRGARNPTLSDCSQYAETINYQFNPPENRPGLGAVLGDRNNCIKAKQTSNVYYVGHECPQGYECLCVIVPPKERLATKDEV